MFVTKQVRIKLRPPMPKILCASVAFKNTFVVVREDIPGDESSIVHLDAKGKILSQINYSYIINGFGMMRDDEVIVLNIPLNKIDIINLETHKVTQVDHKYHQCDKTTLYTFFETKLFCVVERGYFQIQSIFLTYYSYDRTNQKTKPRLVQKLNSKWSNDHFIRKLNNHSKIGWWKWQYGQEIVFNYSDLKSDHQGNFSTVKAKIDPSNFYGARGIYINIEQLWEIRDNQYMLVGNSNKHLLKNKCKTKGVFNDNYIVDATAGNDKATLRETNFVFDIDQDGVMLNSQLINCFGLGPISVFHTFKHKNGESVKSPVYYVLNETEEIVEKKTWKCALSNSNFFFPGWEEAIVVQSAHNSGYCKDISFFILKWVFNFSKDKILQMLLHLNEDFDDDLLGDAVEMLT